jgi:uncharacterized protein (TIGR02996 family)
VTTEDDFQAALDAQPDDWQTRLVFADWLQERGDPRAEGHRALVAIGRRAVPCQMATTGGVPGLVLYIFGTDRMSVTSTYRIAYEGCIIPFDWFRLLGGSMFAVQRGSIWRHYRTRREAEDAATAAFAGLPPRRRAKLLAPQPAPPKKQPDPPKKRTRRK